LKKAQGGDDRKLNNFVITVFGMGLVIGSLVNVLKFPILIMFSVGLGVVIGGIYREIKSIKK